MAPINMTDSDTVRFLLLCIDKCDTKAIDYEEVAEATGLNGYKAAYKKLWDLKNKHLAKNEDASKKSRAKLKKNRSPKSSP
ncbi:hypothetical protein H072_5054 [Dactylellina haptotyla CBS 200.50]|uniref:Myb-like DNA-binding domain-containing protein n=1 Tax=Dactylellina haptotyla (strain CBS 200.50) TaxID=1284197 RepID=S8C0D1_DACHA|nr:hypothetical protein H072_5054 [Dactylellina haptotyla CBS 200.50]